MPAGTVVCCFVVVYDFTDARGRSRHYSRYFRTRQMAERYAADKVRRGYWVRTYKDTTTTIEPEYTDDAGTIHAATLRTSWEAI